VPPESLSPVISSGIGHPDGMWVEKTPPPQACGLFQQWELSRPQALVMFLSVMDQASVPVDPEILMTPKACTGIVCC